MIDNRDVVVDSQEELTWRLRAFCGLRNTMGSRIVAIGGPSGWGIGGLAPKNAKEHWNLDFRTVTYPELAEHLRAKGEPYPPLSEEGGLP